MATEQTITVYQGEQALLNFTMAPVVDISAWTLMFTVATKAGSVTKKIGPLAMTILSGPSGTFKISLTAAQLGLPLGTYYYDVWRTDVGFEQVLALGAFTVAGTARLPPAV